MIKSPIKVVFNGVSERRTRSLESQKKKKKKKKKKKIEDSKIILQSLKNLPKIQEAKDKKDKIVKNSESYTEIDAMDYSNFLAVI